MSNTVEERIRQLELSDARKDVALANLTLVVQANTAAITELTAVLNRGKGAAWAMAGVYTIFGGLLATIISYLKS